MLLIIDLESTCWDTNSPLVTHQEKQKQNKEMETIEIGATLLTIVEKKKLEVVKSFSQFVRPVINPTLSNFCKDLTSITQEDVDLALTFPDALNKFVKDVEKHLGGDTIDKIIWSSWGAYDRKQLIKDCLYHKINYPFGVHWNVKEAHGIANGHKRGRGLGRAIRDAGLTFEGTHHRGIDDTINIARVVQIYLTNFYIKNIRRMINYK